MSDDATRDTITVSAEHREQVGSDHADVLVTIKGSSLVRGSMALTKAREVNQLVSDLGRLGLPADSFAIEGVRLESGGVAVKSSAHYRLRVRRVPSDDIADAVGVIAGQKSASLESLEWRYPDDEEARGRWLAQALKRAVAKAEICAAALGVRLLGVASMSETFSDQSPAPARFAATAAAKSRGLGAVQFTGDDLGVTIGHHKTVVVSVTVSFRVSPLAAS